MGAEELLGQGEEEEGSIPKETKEASGQGCCPAQALPPTRADGAHQHSLPAVGLTFDPVMLLLGLDLSHIAFYVGRVCPTWAGICVSPGRVGRCGQGDGVGLQVQKDPAGQCQDTGEPRSDVGWLRFSLGWHGGHLREAVEFCVDSDQAGWVERERTV